MKRISLDNVTHTINCAVHVVLTTNFGESTISICSILAIEVTVRLALVIHDAMQVVGLVTFLKKKSF